MMTALLIAAVSLGCHELGHILCAVALGVEVKRVGFRCFSPYTVREPGTDVQNLAISLAGPAVNLALGAAIMLTPWLGLPAVIFAVTNIALGLFNLIPIPLSDGRRILALVRK